VRNEINRLVVESHSRKVEKMSLSPKKVSESCVESTYMVLPEHTNALGSIFGGTIMSWVDITASIVAFRHCRSLVVTASMDEMSFLHPVKLGDLVTVKASLNYTSKHSMELGVKVIAENPVTAKRTHTSSAYLTFVSLDGNGKAQPVPPVMAESDDEKRRYEEGKIRYEIRKKKRK